MTLDWGNNYSNKLLKGQIIEKKLIHLTTFTILTILSVQYSGTKHIYCCATITTVYLQNF